MQFIEDHEKSPRVWYGGAVGYVGFDGSLNTGITIRTIRVHRGVVLAVQDVPYARLRERLLRDGQVLNYSEPATPKAKAQK